MHTVREAPHCSTGETEGETTELNLAQRMLLNETRTSVERTHTGDDSVSARELAIPTGIRQSALNRKCLI